MGKLVTLSATMSASVGLGGTFTIDYPAGTTADEFMGAVKGTLYSQARNPMYLEFGHFSIAYGASSMSITILHSTGFTNGELVYLDIYTGNSAEAITVADASKMYVQTLVRILLGAPIAADTDSVCTAETLTGASAGDAIPIDGALASNGVATLDVPRALTFTSSGDDTGITITATGTDEFGNAVVETVTGANAGAAAGKKAFKTVTSVTVSDASAGTIAVGHGDVLGLPVFLGDVTDVIKEVQDGAAPTAGTAVAGVVGTATATTGDVRGTYDPNAACDGSRVFELLIAASNPSAKGVTQYAA